MKKKKKIEQEEPEKWDFRDKMIDGYSPYPSLGAYEYVRSLENIVNETEEHHFNEKLEFMKIQQEIYLKEEGFSPEKCIAELESPVSSKFVSVRINGERHEYYNLRKTSLNEIVDIILLQTTSEEVLEELKEIVKRLEKDTQDKTNKAPVMKSEENEEFGHIEKVPFLGAEEDKELLDKLKNPPQFEPFDSDLFTEKIAETANKTAQVSHDLEMKRIKAKMIADVTVELIKYNGDKIFPQRIAEMAREIAENALKNI